MNIPVPLHQSSQLIFVSISVWSARKLDRKTTSKLTAEHNATADAARVNKYLMSSADDQLKAIQTIARRVRGLVEQKTLPWDDAGNRLISNFDSFELLGELHALRLEFESAVDEFCKGYPDMREASLKALGDMADPSDYPSVEMVRTKFAIRTSMQPIPRGFDDARVGLSPEQVEQLDKHYEALSQERFEEAMKAAFGRLRENVERYVDRLSLTEDGKTKPFTYTMVENTRATLGMITNLGLFNTAELQKLGHDIEVKLCAHDAGELKNSIGTAQSTKAAAEDILKRLQSIGYGVSTSY